MRFSPVSNRPVLRQSRGFTLVEILVVVPIVILVIAVLVGFLVTLTGDAMMARERASMVYTSQDALNQIERDIRVGTLFLETSGPMTSPQGSDNGTAAFSNPDEQLILKQHATIGSPYDGSRTLAYYSGRPNDCNDYHEYNEPVQAMIIYFVEDGDLHRRTVVDLDGPVCGGITSSIWQVNTCSVDPDLSNCITRDSILASDVSDFSISYYRQPDSALPTVLNGMTARVISTADVSITLSKEVAGETIEHTNNLRASRLSAGYDWRLESE